MLGAALLLAVSAPPTQLAVVARTAGPEGGISAVDVEAAAMRGAVWFFDVALVPRGDLRARVETELRACGRDFSCASARLVASGVDRAILAFTNLSIRPGVTTIELLDVHERRVVATEVLPVTADPLAGIEPAVRRLMLAGGHRLGAKLTLATAPPDATVALSPGVAIVAGGQTVVVPPGAYRISAEAEDHEPGVRTVELEAGGAETVELALEPAGSFLASPWPWVGAAVVVAAGITLFVVLDRPPTRFCHPDPCPP